MSEVRRHKKYGRQPVEFGRFFVFSLKMCTFAPQKAEAPIGRVVYRGYNNANANGGVSYANANNDASNTNTNIGSRLDNNQRNLNRRTTAGTCPQGGAEGAEPRQKRLNLVETGHGYGYVPERRKTEWRVEFGRAETSRRTWTRGLKASAFGSVTKK